MPPEETTQVIRLDDHVIPRVLIVDDDDLVAEHLATLVRNAGFEVSVVTSGAAALSMLHKDFAPIVISDRNMPDMDGLTLCRTIRAEHVDNYVYVILLTVQDSEQDILSGLDAGADDYLSKRSSAAQLLARLRTAQRILTLERSLRSVIAQKTSRTHRSAHRCSQSALLQSASQSRDSCRMAFAEPVVRACPRHRSLQGRERQAWAWCGG
jgi:DNA-binding response OmpR family regulator